MSLLICIFASWIIGRATIRFLGIQGSQGQELSTPLGIFIFFSSSVLVARVLGLFHSNLSIRNLVLALSSTSLLTIPYLSKNRSYLGFFSKTSIKHLLQWDHIVFILVLLLTLFLPIYENDTLEYIGVSRQLNLKNLYLNYPPIHSDAIHSLYAGSIHPLIFHFILLTLFPTSSSAFLFRVFIALVVYWTAKNMVRSRKFGLGLIVASPVYVSSVMGGHIDSLRILSIVLSIRLILSWLSGECNTLGVILGILLPSSVHTSGLLVSFCFLIAVLMSNANKLFSDFKKVKWLVVSFVLLSLFCSQYLFNFLEMGVFFSDSNDSSTLPLLQYGTFVKYSRFMPDFSSAFKNSFLALVINPFYNGPAIFFSVVQRFRLRKSKFSKSNEFRFYEFTILTFLSIFVFSLVLGVDLISKSPRYSLILVPIAAGFCSSCLEKDDN